MSWTIEKQIELDAPRERVWAAISDPKELEKWFPDEAEFDPQPGARGSLTWHNHGSPAMEIIEFDPPRRFVWRWEGNDGRALDEYSTTVEWTLTDRPGGGTTLTVRETGFDSQKHHEQNAGGWKEELAQLVAYLKGS